MDPTVVDATAVAQAAKDARRMLQISWKDTAETVKAARAAIRVALMLGFLAVSLTAGAQAPQRVSRIGWLAASARPPDVAMASQIFRRELLALGWVEGQHYVLEYRFADGRARLPALAAELLALPVDVILAVSSPAAQAAKAATTSVPIVFQVGSNPVAGLVASLAHPGGNLTTPTKGYERSSSGY